MRLRVMLTIMTLWLCLPFLAFGEEAGGSDERVNRALLVGCDRFISQMDTVPSSANNVNLMAQALSGGTMELANLVTRPEGITTTSELAALMDETFAGADDNDVSYFYISTHGVWEEGTGSGGMMLLLSDGERESSVTARQLRRLFDGVPGKKVLLLDACHAGAMIGKGVNEHLSNIFAGSDYVVICSSGGAEESWFWSGDIDGERLAGAGYFSGALVRALSDEGGYGADDNRDGSITLTELRRYLLDNHGASTVRTYPENSDFALLTYDAAAYTGRGRDALIEGVTFEADVLSTEEPTVYFTYNVVRSVQVAYQLVYHRNGRWDFDNAQLIYDNNGQYSNYSIAGRTLSPGMKERAIVIERADAGSSGYVLLQLLTIERGMPAVVSSRVLCVPPDKGDPALSVEMKADFCPGAYEEMTFIVRHGIPCEMTVTIIDSEGKTVSRLASRQPTRPEHLSPSGTSFTWDGMRSNGDPAEEGAYRIKIKAYVGGETYELISDEFLLLALIG
ncbi:MAG: caspase family protein [Clostridia bacterium]|nr:caspase family protein [Clostridia bacterium]